MGTIQSNKEIIRTLYDQSLNKRDLGLLSYLIDEDYVGIAGAKGAAGFAEPIAVLIKAFPDIHWTVEDLIGEGDQVVVRWSWQGTHTHPFRDITATGKTITNRAIAIYELKEGKIISTQIQTDRLGFLQDLEVIPADLLPLRAKKVNGHPICFIDKFFVPSPAKQVFDERMHINRQFIEKLPGFMEDAVYEHTDEKGNLICLTIAKWESQEALDNAKETVQAEYQRQGFNPADMFQQHGIKLERAIFSEREPSS